jgi:PleD family two-component response regulator
LKHNILCVDEYEVAGLELSRMLNDESIKIINAKNGDEAYRLLKKEACSFDVLVWNLNVSGVQNLGSIEEFIGEYGPGKIPVVVIAELAGRKYVEKAAALGVHEYIVRPFEPESVKRKIFNIIGLTYEEPLTVMIDDILTYSFSEIYNREIQSASRGSYPLSIMLVSVSGMDSCSGETGQLEKTAELLKKIIDSRLRDTDTAFHFKGCNLLLLLPFTDKDGSRDVEEKIREIFLSHTMLKNQIKGLKLIISSVTYPDDGKVKETLLKTLWAVQRSKTEK